MKQLEAVAIGTCYWDYLVEGFSFGEEGLPNESEPRGDHYTTAAGGSAPNYCRTLGELGLASAFIGVGGDDEPASAIEADLRRCGVEPYITKLKGVSTMLGFNLTSTTGAHIPVIAGSANGRIAPEFVMPRLEELLPQANRLHLGGCYKLPLLYGSFDAITALARQHGTLISIDHNRVPDGISPEGIAAVRKLVLGADIYFPSIKEFLQTWDVDSPEAGLRRLADEAPQLQVVVKDGPNGSYHLEDGTFVHTPTEPAVVRNATGLGDTFDGAATAALAAGQSLGDAARFAHTFIGAKLRGEPLPSL